MKYNNWKGYVVANFIDAIDKMDKDEREKIKSHINFLNSKPIVATENKIYVKIYIEFKDKTHGDGDNIFKGICDALFMNDKYIAGEFDYEYSKDKIGKIDIEITIYDK